MQPCRPMCVFVAHMKVMRAEPSPWAWDACLEKKRVANTAAAQASTTPQPMAQCALFKIPKGLQSTSALGGPDTTGVVPDAQRAY